MEHFSLFNGFPFVWVITPLSLPTQFQTSAKYNSLSLSPTPLPHMSYLILKKHNYKLEPPMSKL